MRLAAALALAVFLALPARAVIIDSGDGTGNTSAPADDPGWAHVGTKLTGGLTVIYLGNHWVLTANHVAGSGAPDVVFGGVTYRAVAGSKVQLENDSGNPPDLAVFRLNMGPDLPILPIRDTSPSASDDVVMIGRGRDRGDATTWMGKDGYEWDLTTSIRWGTNVVTNTATVEIGGTKTESFYTNFTTSGGTTHECQAALGDSGGAAFIEDGSTWELAGVMFTRGEYSGQPAQTALDGNLSYMADLSVYRDQIIELTRPQCSDEVDNDGDSLIDYPDDPQCADAAGRREAPLPTSVPGLSATGLAILAGSLIGSAGVAGRWRKAR